MYEQNISNVKNEKFFQKNAKKRRFSYILANTRMHCEKTSKNSCRLENFKIFLKSNFEEILYGN